MVLLDKAVEIFDLSQFDRFWQDSSGFEIGNGFGIGRVFIDIDHPWHHPADPSTGRNEVLLDRGDFSSLRWGQTVLRSRTRYGWQCFEEKALGRFGISCRAQEEFQ